MKKCKSKKVLSVVLSSLMVLSASPALCISSLAATEPPVSGYSATNTVGGFCGDKYEGREKEVTWELDTDEGILYINGTGIVGDTQPWKEYKDIITTVIVGEGITELKSSAFSSMTSLKAITLPSTLKKIGDSVFFNAQVLETINIPEGVTEIGKSAFYYCYALESIELPASLQKIGESAFSHCNALDEIVVSEDSEYFMTDEDGVLYSKDKAVLVRAPIGLSGTYEIPEGVTTLSMWSMSYCNNLTEVIMPSTVTKMESCTFRESANLTTVEIDGNDLTVGDYSFYNCKNLTNVIIGDGVTAIGTMAFYKCTKLASINIPDNVTKIENSAFVDCTRLGTINLSDNITEIGIDAFKNTLYFNRGANWEDGLLYLENALIATKDTISGSIEIKEGTTVLRDGIFSSRKNITDVTIPEGVTKIPYSAFSHCSSLTHISLPDGLLEIGRYSFPDCTALENVEFPDTLLKIENQAFQGCTNFTEINLPDNIVSLTGSVFYKCSGVETVTIPASLQTLDSYVFGGMASLTDIFVDEANEYYTSVDGVLFTKDQTVLIKFPDGKAIAYYAVPDGTVEIGNEAFADNVDLIEVDIPASVTRIGYNVFSYCENLETVNLSEGLKEIGCGAFAGCENLVNITLPDGLILIEDNAFSYCINLTEINLPDSLEEICGLAFSGSGIKSIVLPGNLTYYESMFECTDALETVVLSEGITKVDWSAFYGCGIKTVVLPSTLEVIDTSAFEACTYLESIVIPAGTEEIRKEAFLNCTSLEYVVIPASVTTIDETAFDGVSATIICEAGSAAEAFAIENGLDVIVHDSDAHMINPGEPVIETDIAATCVQDGRYYKMTYCEDCGELISAEIINVPAYAPETGHTPVTVPASDPTCTVPGNESEYTYCAVCDELLEGNKKIIPELNHPVESYEIDVGKKAATCTEDGYTGDIVCGLCGEVVSAGTVVEAVGHRYSELRNYKEATCTEMGYSGDVYCVICGEIVIEGEDTPIVTVGAKHTDVDKDHYCDDCGGFISNCEDNDSDHFCEYCGKELSEHYDRTHDHKCDLCGAIVSDHEDTDNSHFCDICNEKISDCIDVDVKDHYCDICGTVMPGEDGVHTYVQVGEVHEATCTDSEYIDEVCTYCGHEEISVIAPALGHDIVILDAKAATCSEPGLTQGQYCTRCDNATVAQIETPTKDHTPAEAVTENIVPATIDARGSYDDVIYCADCGTELDRIHHTTDKLTAMTFGTDDGTVWEYTEKTNELLIEGDGELILPDDSAELDVIKERVEKIVIDDGITEIAEGAFEGFTNLKEIVISGDVTKIDKDAFKDCDDLEKVIFKGTEKDWAEMRIAAGNDNLKNATVVFENAAPHTYVPVVTAPTCLAKGYTVYTCAYCGDEYTADYKAATGHKDADEDFVCDNCGEDIPHPSDTFRCSMCDMAENADSNSLTGFIINMVHMLVHLLSKLFSGR